MRIGYTITHTSSGNQTPGCVLPSRIASAKAAVAIPTDLKNVHTAFVITNKNKLYYGFMKVVFPSMHNL